MGVISWVTTNPIDHTLNSEWPQEVRNMKNLLLSRVQYTANEPSARPDSSAYEANDNGSLWIDSDNNRVSILTAYGTPTWTLLYTDVAVQLVAAAHTWAAAQTFGGTVSIEGAVTLTMSNPTVTITNTDEEDSDGGRQSQIRFKDNCLEFRSL